MTVCPRVSVFTWHSPVCVSGSVCCSSEKDTGRIGVRAHLTPGCPLLNFHLHHICKGPVSTEIPAGSLRRVSWGLGLQQMKWGVGDGGDTDFPGL